MLRWVLLVRGPARVRPRLGSRLQASTAPWAFTLYVRPTLGVGPSSLRVSRSAKATPSPDDAPVTRARGRFPKPVMMLSEAVQSGTFSDQLAACHDRSSPLLPLSR